MGCWKHLSFDVLLGCLSLSVLLICTIVFLRPLLPLLLLSHLPPHLTTSRLLEKCAEKARVEKSYIRHYFGRTEQGRKITSPQMANSISDERVSPNGDYIAIEQHREEGVEHEPVSLGQPQQQHTTAGTSDYKHADDAMQAFTGHEGEVITVDAETNKRLLRIIDRRMLLMMCAVHGMNHLDSMQFLTRPRPF